MKLRVKPGVEFRRLGDEGILFDPETCKFYRLSAEAVKAWEASQCSGQESDLSVRAEYDVFTVAASVPTCPPGYRLNKQNKCVPDNSTP